MIIKLKRRPPKDTPRSAFVRELNKLGREVGGERFPQGWKDHVITLEKTFAQAKAWVETAATLTGIERTWVEAVPPHSYDQSKCMVMISVLESVPPLGYVVVDCYRGTVQAFVGGFIPSRGFQCLCGHCGYDVRTSRWEWRDKP